MKIKDAIRILNMFDDNTEVELIFPDSVKAVNTPRKPQLTEGQMANLPMYPALTVLYTSETNLDDTFMSGRWKD